MSANVIDMSIPRLRAHPGIIAQEDETRELCSEADEWSDGWMITCADCLDHEFGDTARRLAEIAHNLGWRVVDGKVKCRVCVPEPEGAR